MCTTSNCFLFPFVWGVFLCIIFIYTVIHRNAFWIHAHQDKICANYVCLILLQQREACVKRQRENEVGGMRERKLFIWNISLMIRSCQLYCLTAGHWELQFISCDVYNRYKILNAYFKTKKALYIVYQVYNALPSLRGVLILYHISVSASDISFWNINFFYNLGNNVVLK